MLHVKQCKINVPRETMQNVPRETMQNVPRETMHKKAAALGAGGSGYGGGGLRQLLWGQGAVATAAEGYGSCL